MNNTNEPEPIEDVENEERNKAQEEWNEEEYEEGSCQGCGEALNNAEGEYCPSCYAGKLNI